MFDITALGELLIDFTTSGTSETGMRLFEQNPGGAPANVLCAMSRLGLKTAFIGKVGQDMHGNFLKETLESVGIETAGLIMDSNVFTTLAFVELSSTGERSFSFARKPGADTCLTKEEVNADIIEKSGILHVGSLSLTNEPCRSATLYAIETAKKAGKILSYDPNYRALLWDTREKAMEQMRSILPFVDILKISDEETELMTGAEDPYKASEILVNGGIPVVVVTLGAKGALVRTRDGVAEVPGFKSQCVDTTGAGDSFWGGFLYSIAKNQADPGKIDLEEAKKYVRFANAVASLCVEKRGAILAMPTIDMVEERLKR